MKIIFFFAFSSIWTVICQLDRQCTLSWKMVWIILTRNHKIWSAAVNIVIPIQSRRKFSLLLSSQIGTCFWINYIVISVLRFKKKIILLYRSYIAKPASSWLDDYFDWSVLPSCCKVSKTNDSFCPHSSK